jgi:hypothetical protein
MKNNEQQSKRFSWVEIVLVIGHLVIIAGLGISALGARPVQPPLVPSISILDSLEEASGIKP